MAYAPSFVALAFQNRLEYRNGDGRVDSRDDSPPLYRNLVSFGPITPECRLEKILPLDNKLTRL